MKKIIVVVLFFMVFSFLADAHYVRKVREPNFFIPETDRMHKPEKLPKIERLRENKKEINIEKKKIVMSVPEYKNKYNKYIADMAVFANSRVMPDNEELDKDLSFMQTGDVFEVVNNTSDETSSIQQKEFYRIMESILNN